jgi:hypothetical protein
LRLGGFSNNYHLGKSCFNWNEEITMKKVIAYLIIFLLMATPTWSFAATCTFQSGGVDLLWSTIGNWDCSHVPVADDVVIVPTGLIASVDVERIPATSGKIASLTGTGTGQITIDLSAAICDTECSINVTGDVQAGLKPTTSGFILISGAGTGHTTKLDAANFIGGTDTNSYCVNITATAGTVNTFGHAKGNSGQGSRGIQNSSTATLAHTGAVTAGQGAGSYGFGTAAAASANSVTGDITASTKASAMSNQTTGTMVLVGNLIDSTYVAWEGKIPTTWGVGNALYYYQTVGGVKLFSNTDPLEVNVKTGTTYYFESNTVKTGTYSAGGGGAWAN